MSQFLTGFLPPERSFATQQPARIPSAVRGTNHAGASLTLSTSSTAPIFEVPSTNQKVELPPLPSHTGSIKPHFFSFPCFEPKIRPETQGDNQSKYVDRSLPRWAETLGVVVAGSVAQGMLGTYCGIASDCAGTAPHAFDVLLVVMSGGIGTGLTTCATTSTDIVYNYNEKGGGITNCTPLGHLVSSGISPVTLYGTYSALAPLTGKVAVGICPLAGAGIATVAVGFIGTTFFMIQR